MSSKSTIVLTADNEHIYSDCNEPLITSDGRRKDAITVEVDLVNARVECCDDYDLVFTLTNPDSEIYALFEGIGKSKKHLPDADTDTPSKIMFESIIETTILKAENEALRAALDRIIAAYDENDPGGLYDVVGLVKKELKW